MTPIISTNPQSMTMESFRESDLPHLHELITEQARLGLAISLESDAKVHELLDALARQFPEYFRVFRSKNGIPLTFSVGLLLYRETIDFLEPFIPHVLENCYPLEIRRMKQLRLYEADTHYQLLAASTSQDPHYSFYELNGILLADHFSTYSVMGLRCTVITKLEETVSFMRGVGFPIRALLGLPEEHPSYGASIIEFDLRSLDFGNFVLALLHAFDNNVNLEADPVSTETDIKTVLKLGKNADSLGKTAFARNVNSSGILLQQKLQELLNQEPPLPPLNKRMQDLLRLMYDEPHLNVEIAASRMHISRATYYRDQREALRHLNELLNKFFDAKR